MLEPHIEVELKGSEELQRRLEGIERALRGDRLVEPWQRAVELIGASAVEKAPDWEGRLRASINYEVILGGPGEGGVYGEPGTRLRGVEREDITGVVYTDVFYGPFQERGTDPYFPNLEALELWAEEHGKSAFEVALAISERGIIPLKFFEGALLENEDAVVELIDEVVARVMEQEY